MTISEDTLKEVAESIRAAIAGSCDDIDLAMCALQAFCDHASLDDVDALNEEAMSGR